MQGFTIAPVGTCRIHTPLRRGAARFPYQVTLNRNYGFVHTSREVIQQLDVLRGGAPVEERLRPLVYRPNTTDAFFEKAAAEADLYFIEISSAKHVSIGEVPIQLNYASRYFGDFFGDKQLARRFWSLGSEARAQERLQWLQDQRQFQKLTPDDRQLLSEIHIRELTEDDVDADVARVIDLVGRDKAVFISHVNAHTPDDLPIASRQRLIEAFRKIAARHGVTFYDPTAAMLKFGQLRAMENDGLDLTHFTLPFSDALAEDWFGTFIAPRIAASPAAELVAAEQADLGALRALLSADRIVEASRTVREEIRAGRTHPDCYRLLGQIQHRLGDYEGAIESLEFVRGRHGATKEEDVLLLLAYHRLGNFAAALEYGRSLLSDEKETPEILRTSAEAAQAVGDEDKALTYWKRLFQLDASPDAASAVLALLDRHGEHAEVVDWADQVLQVLPEHVDSVLAKWAVSLGERDIGNLLDVATHSRLLSDEKALELARQSTAAGLASPAAALIAPRLVYSQVAPEIAAWGKQQAVTWREKGLAALDARDLALATDLIQASQQLAPNAGASIRAKRTLEQTLRREVREAFLAKDHAKVVALTSVAVSTAANFPEIDSFAGRSAAELGDLDKALAHLKKATETDASSAPQIQLARVAVQAADYLEAIRAYNAVVADDDAQDWARAEATRKLSQLLSPAIRSGRENADAGRVRYAWDLLDQAGQHPENRERTQKEQERIYRRLRKDLKAVDPSDVASRLSVAETILNVVPDDPTALRVGASAAMRLHRFEQAKELWNALAAGADAEPQIQAAIAKCDLWIERARKKKVA